MSEISSLISSVKHIERLYRKRQKFCDIYERMMADVSNRSSVEDIEEQLPKTAEALRIYWRTQIGEPVRPAIEQSRERNGVTKMAVRDGSWYLWKDQDPGFDDVHKAYEECFDEQT